MPNQNAFLTLDICRCGVNMLLNIISILINIYTYFKKDGERNITEFVKNTWDEIVLISIVTIQLALIFDRTSSESLFERKGEVIYYDDMIYNF
jgi:hypothetical protein